MIKLYPHQEEDSEFHLRARWSLNYSEMGTGKTFTALAAAKKSGEKILVVGPAFLAMSWKKAAKLFQLDIKYLSFGQLRKLRKKEARERQFWIVDEIHYLKNPETKRTNYFHTRLEAIKPKFFLGLSGTPVENRVPEIWTSLMFCSMSPTNTNGIRLSGELEDYHDFATRFCRLERYWISGREIRKYIGLRRRGEFKSLLRGKYVRRLLDKVVDDIPEITRNMVPLSLRQDDDLLELFDDYMDGEKKDISAKTQSAILNVSGTVDYCKDLLKQVDQIVIFTDHREPAKMLARELDGVWCTGEINANRRELLVEDFQAGKVKVLVATIGSLSVGVTLTKSRHVVFNDFSWVPSRNRQAEGRVRRIGQKYPTFAHYLFSTATDEYIYEVTTEKQETIDEVLDAS